MSAEALLVLELGAAWTHESMVDRMAILVPRGDVGVQATPEMRHDEI